MKEAINILRLWRTNIVKKNRIWNVVLVTVLCLGLLPGCGKNETQKKVENVAEKISIVCTTFPQYDWVREIIGKNNEKFELTLLIDNGVDLHNYQPTAEDIAKIGMADIFIHVGGESDGWVSNVLEKADNEELKVINLMEVMGDKAKTEELVEGMQESEHHHEQEDEDHEHEDGDHEHEDEEHEHEGEGHNHEDGGPEYDEHIWLSLKNASVLVSEISDVIQSVETEGAAEYATNCEGYIQKLNDLDKKYEKLVEKAQYKTVVFGDRFPFRYLVDDYGLDYYAAFIGCSAETEASFETITFLAGKVDEIGVPAILVIEKSNQEIAKTIKENTLEKNQKILEMNSIQSVTKEEIEAGFTYLKAMEENYACLKQALSGTDDVVDCDLTKMGSNMVYATVFQMMMKPNEYVGKTVKMEGTYYSTWYEETKKQYHYCIIQDALACCAQGMEFIWGDGNHSYPQEYPNENAQIEVTGVFETYKEKGDENLYCRLEGAALEVVENKE